MYREVRLQTSQHIYVYCEEDKIGEGGFGCVYSGTEINQKIPVAIKRPHFYSDEALEKFKNKDCRYLPKLQHEHIVKVFAVFTEVNNERGVSGPPALIMEYISGKNLQLSWEREIHPLSVQQRLLLFRKICTAIHYAHEQDIIHRDLKPGNILLTSDHQPKIIDFGLAASLKPEEMLRASRTDQFIGSLLYMAPEQQNARNADKKSDIYSLGLILFFVFTGKHARDLLLKGESTLHQVFDAHLSAEISLLCKATCQLDKAKRTRSVQKLVENIDLLLPIIPQGMPAVLNSSGRRLHYSPLVCGGILVGSALEQLFYTTDYWWWLWLILSGILAVSFVQYNAQRIASVRYREINAVTIAVAVGMMASRLLENSNWGYYFILLISISTLVLWFYLLYETIRP